MRIWVTVGAEIDAQPHDSPASADDVADTQHAHVVAPTRGLEHQLGAEGAGIIDGLGETQRARGVVGVGPEAAVLRTLAGYDGPRGYDPALEPLAHRVAGAHPVIAERLDGVGRAGAGGGVDLGLGPRCPDGPHVLACHAGAPLALAAARQPALASECCRCLADL